MDRVRQTDKVTIRSTSHGVLINQYQCIGVVGSGEYAEVVLAAVVSDFPPTEKVHTRFAVSLFFDFVALGCAEGLQ